VRAEHNPDRARQAKVFRQKDSFARGHDSSFTRARRVREFVEREARASRKVSLHKGARGLYTFFLKASLTKSAAPSSRATPTRAIRKRKPRSAKPLT